MLEELKIKKWWWENASEFKKSPKNIWQDYNKSIKQIVVVSAIRSPEFNTTDNLIKLANVLNWLNSEEVYQKIQEIEKFHINILKEKLWWNFKIEQFIKKYFINNFLKKINDWINYNWDDKIFPWKNNDYSIWFWDKTFSIIGFWEELSANLQVELINNLWIDWLKVKKVDLDWITKWLDWEGESIIFEELSRKIKSRVNNILNEEKVVILSWYIPWFKGGIENKIGRWYTDATASMTAIWLSNNYDVTLEIQKSVKWMLSADPRIIKDAKLIEKIDYLTAKEITWVRGSQAKLLHSQVLRKELLIKWIKVKLFDPFSDSKWTLISRNKNPESSWVEYIWVRDNITFFSISSWDMSDSWILADVFSIFKEYNISIDIVSTSETEISFTIDNWIDNNILNKISDKIRNKLDIKENDDINYINYQKNKALIFCIWQNLSNHTGALSKATSALANAWINIEIASQGSKERSMIFWIDDKNMKNAVEVLHKEFIK